MKTVLLMLFLLILGVSGLYTEECMAGSEPRQNKDLVVILGASYAKGWNPGKIDNMIVSNRGVSGEQSFEMLARFERDVVAFNPRAVIIWGFINDIFRGQREDMSLIKNRTRESFIKMIELAKVNNIEPILTTEVTIKGPDTWSEKIGNIVGWIMSKESYQDYINNNVLEINKWIKKYGVDQGLLVLDIQPVLAEKSGMRKKEYAAPDGSHISSQGYERISKYAFEVLENYFKSK